MCSLVASLRKKNKSGRCRWKRAVTDIEEGPHQPGSEFRQLMDPTHPSKSNQITNA